MVQAYSISLDEEKLCTGERCNNLGSTGKIGRLKSHGKGRFACPVRSCNSDNDRATIHFMVRFGTTGCGDIENRA
jgi:hypothetical protein